MTSDNAIGTITMIGSGSASATPDIMRVNISVETRADTVAAAYARAGQRADAVIGALRADGVAGRDINTSGLTVRADTVWTDGNREQLVGYIAGTSLTVTLRDIATDKGEAKSDETGPAAIIAHAVDAGGDDVRLGGLTLAVADEEALMVRARDAAWDHALGKAEQYVYRASRTLGPVVEITENISGPVPQPRIAFAANKVGGYAESIPVELGESELSTTIRVTWQLV
ncbi:SIMPL domain-containing protein [Nocardia sp. CDC160]|uniref:SIMPL domain-containing protein n=1 Tax=Nocardia sp. CDC160 TaxID=3112166 RepID=UPI002DBF235E|nr:SIMPL domain-containing protein [Nocardia sp. CDC160]MEC3914469.1 SIMPL domain-containing protein [Nocardia sp. CDC160]